MLEGVLPAMVRGWTPRMTFFFAWYSPPEGGYSRALEAQPNLVGIKGHD